MPSNPINLLQAEAWVVSFKIVLSKPILRSGPFFGQIQFTQDFLHHHGICAYLDIKGGQVPKTDRPNETEKYFNSQLVGKIYGLAESGHLTQVQANALHHHRHIGNEALHQLTPISSEELRIGIELIDHTLKTIFELPMASQKMADLSHKRKLKK